MKEKYMLLGIVARDILHLDWEYVPYSREVRRLGPRAEWKVRPSCDRFFVANVSFGIFSCICCRVAIKRIQIGYLKEGKHSSLARTAVSLQELMSDIN